MNDNMTNAASHSAVSQALEALFVEETPEAAFDRVSAQAVQRHLADCEACRQLYDGLALADRLLAPNDQTSDETSDQSSFEALDAPDPFTAESASFEANFGHAAFSAALDDLLEEEAAEDDSSDESDERDASIFTFPGNTSLPGGSMGWVAAAAAVLLIGASSWLIFGGDVQQPSIAGDDDFQARTAASAHEEGPFEQPDVELFCVRRTSEGVNFTGKEDAPFGLLSCPADAELKLAYRNPSKRLKYAAFFGVDETGKIYWYGPSPADTEPVEVGSSTEVRPVGETIRLSVNHQPGRVRVAGIFASEPIDFVTLRRVIDKMDTDALYRGERPADLSLRGTVATSSFEVIDGGTP